MTGVDFNSSKPRPAVNFLLTLYVRGIPKGTGTLHASALQFEQNQVATQGYSSEKYALRTLRVGPQWS